MTYLRSKELFEEKKLNEAKKYQEKIYKEVRDGKRNSAYRAIRRLGNQPGEGGHKDIVLPAYMEEGLEEGQSSRYKPILTQHQVYTKMKMVT